MARFNTFYLVVFGVGVVLWYMTTVFQHEVTSFYGIAQTKETEVGRNYELSIDKIYIAPGENVTKGQKLFDISRVRSEEKLVGEDYRIDQLRAEERVWSQTKNNDIRAIESEREIRINDLNNRIIELTNELSRKKSLLEGLSSITVGSSDFKPLENRITALKEEKRLVMQAYDDRVSAVSGELDSNKNPYTSQIARLKAEKRFYDNTKVITEEIFAPQDGRIGSLNCKVGENVPSFKTLLTIYEPNPDRIIGYVQEDLKIDITDQDSFYIYSQDRSIFYAGSVVHQGSRVVAIPPRFSKVPETVIYGTEINIEIPPDNVFLQGQKVILELRSKLEINESSTDTEQASKLSY